MINILRKKIKFSIQRVFRKVILNVDPIVNVWKIQIVGISITRDIVSHIHRLLYCIELTDF